MRRAPRGLIVSLLIVYLATLACGGSATSTGPAGSLTPTNPPETAIGVEPTGSSATSLPPTANSPEPAPTRTPRPALPAIAITLAEGEVVTATIGSEGGSLRAVDGQGTEYVLTVPAGALFSPVEISMTPIASAEGEAIGDTFLAGVSLQPEGLHFLKLVTIEITGAVVEDGAVGFAAQGGGQNFHLTPSQQSNSSITITATHFTEFGASEEEVLTLLGDLGVPVGDITLWVENELANTQNNAAIQALGTWADLLLAADTVNTFEEWEAKTILMLSLFLRASEAVEAFGWSLDTPGFPDLIRRLQDVLDQWFLQSSVLVESLAQKCGDGDLESLARLNAVIQVGAELALALAIDRDEALRNWSRVRDACLSFTITWQASVVTTGANFFNDISVGSEASTASDLNSGEVVGPLPAALEVEYINGFFDDRCIPTPGSTELAFKVDWRAPNLGTDQIVDDYSLDGITAYVRITEPVFIDCSPAGFEIDADAQAPFHGKALEVLNQDRVNGDGFWEFELVYAPGGGVVAQFAESSKPLDPDNQVSYDLSQLLTLYVASPAN